MTKTTMGRNRDLWRKVPFILRGLLLLACFACSVPVFGAERELSFSRPLSGATYDVGACIPLQVSTSPAATSPVRRLTYYDGSLFIMEVSPPYRYSWTTAPRGTHTLRAVAMHEDGHESVAETTITVNDPTVPIDLANDVDKYDISFTTLGHNARDSMPLGNGDITLNVWTDENGEVGMLIGKMDAFSGPAHASGFFSLRKIGRVRIALDPPVFKQAAAAGTFRQTLVLGSAAIRISGGGSELKIWVDKNRSVVRAELAGTNKVTMTVRNDPWRTQDVPDTHLADIIFPGLTDQVAWCYHDPRTTVGARNAHERDLLENHLPGASLIPQLTTVSFGALVEGSGLRSVDSLTLRSGAVANCRADINVLRYSKTNEATPAKWLALVKEQTETNRKTPIGEAWRDHLHWWRDYWDRGYIVVTNGQQHADVASFWHHLRFMNACQAGALNELWRIPFNGGLFTVDFLDVDVGKGMGVNRQNPKTMMTADFRMWGASDRPQNARHVYWPMLMSGDYDQARAWYLWPGVVAKSWQQFVEKHTSLRGAFMSVGCSGWESLRPTLFAKRDGQAAKRIIPEGVGRERGGYGLCFDVADEYLPYMIDYYELTRDQDFLANYLAPYAEGLFKFFDGYFTRDAKGKLVLWPAMTSEAYVRFPENGYVPANPISGVALLHTQLPRLIALAGQPGVKPEAVELWRRVYDARPDMPVTIRRNGKPGLAPHEPDWDMEQKKTQGADRASLYAIWPYQAYRFPAAGTTPEDYALATNTLALDDNGSQSWKYGDYCAAILGQMERAKKGVLNRINGTGGSKPENYFRFPIFKIVVSPDWTPNVEGGNVILSTMQYMLWNWKGDKIFICPAWPKDWDCKFKFHAPRNTVIQGTVTDGKVRIDTVVPEARRRDIVFCEPQ